MSKIVSAGVKGRKLNREIADITVCNDVVAFPELKNKVPRKLLYCVYRIHTKRFIDLETLLRYAYTLG